VIELYAGDPSSGGTLLDSVTLAGPIPPGGSESVDVALDPLGRNVVVWGVADPDNTIAECNDANNVTRGPRFECDPIVR
jgi:hypothetical protein